MDTAVEASLPTDDGGGDVEAMVTPPGPTMARFEVPRMGMSPNQFLLPWPTDLAVASDGTVDLSYIPGSRTSGITMTYIEQMRGKIRGFSPAGASYFRFTNGLDLASLPATAAASMLATSTVMLVDVDPTTDGAARIPVIFQLRERQSRFWPAWTLAVAPAPGYVLRPLTRYAVVLTRGLRATDRSAVTRDRDFESLAGGAAVEPALQPIATLYRETLTRMQSEIALDPAQVVSMNVFTTSDPTSEYHRAVDVTLSAGTREPTISAITRISADGNMAIYRGTYGPNPVFQRGAAPYLDDNSGGFVVDAMGAPIVQRYENNITFSLTIPTASMRPATGWPIAVYAHGTGGNHSSFIDDGTAVALALQGVACIGFDQLFNGARTIPGGSPESQFFNFANPNAAQSNNRQAAIDLVQIGRLIRNPMAFTVPSMVTGADTETFDGAHLMFFGHSQGGLNGPLWLASRQGPEAAVLSGAGGWLSLSLVLKTEPINIPQVVSSLLGVPRDELTPLHPAITMAQMIADPSDPVHYASAITTTPRMGERPRSVFLTQGFVDRYTPPPAIAALAVSMGLPLINPVIHPNVTSALNDYPRAALPVMSNLAMGRATGGWQQFNAPPRRDGHFVVFDVTDARDRAARFLGSYGRTQIARLD